MDVLFLDANVLFSAAYSPDSPLRVFWRLEGVELVTSAYAAEEARRNLTEVGRRARLEDLLSAVRIVSQITPVLLPPDVNLPEKDLPILIGAIAAGATHLVTGDRRHFGALYGRTIMGVTVVPPPEYLAQAGER
jgi:predicted nucleic acid-binding protein